MNETIAQISVPAELDAGVIVALSLEIKRAVDDPITRVLALRGTDGVFCRGMSLAGVALVGAVVLEPPRIVGMLLGLWAGTVLGALFGSVAGGVVGTLVGTSTGWLVFWILCMGVLTAMTARGFVRGVAR